MQIATLYILTALIFLILDALMLSLHMQPLFRRAAFGEGAEGAKGGEGGGQADKPSDNAEMNAASQKMSQLMGMVDNILKTLGEGMSRLSAK